jgi:hypothetical protein
MGKKGKGGGKKGKKGKNDKKGYTKMTNLSIFCGLFIICINLTRAKKAAKEESIAKMAEQNAQIWEARLKMTEFQKEHYM